MDLNAFYNETVNQSILFNPTPARAVYRGECVQLVMLYIAQVLGVNPPYYAAATDYFERGIPGLTRVVNTPDPNLVPPRGAIVVYSRSIPGSGGNGHIDICWESTPGSAVWTSYDQNWGGARIAKLVTHNYQYVVGWFLPNNLPPAAIPQGDEEMIRTEAEAHQAYKLLRPNGDGAPVEIAGTVGRRTWQGFASDAQTEINMRDANLRAQADELAKMRESINALNDTITTLRTSQGQDQNDLHSAQEKISYLTSQLETSHDKITDLQKADIPAQIKLPPPAPKVNWLTKTILLALALKKKK